MCKFVVCSLSSQTLDVNKNLNCCTEILLESFEQLETVASNRDGLLYGVPLSIKENILYKVMYSYNMKWLHHHYVAFTLNCPLLSKSFYFILKI